MRVQIPGKGFINGVVHDFIDKVVQSPGVGAPDIHGRTLANRCKSLKNGDMRCIVGLGQRKPPLKK